MKGRDGKAAAPTDLLVCFPSRAHLSLMPKQICSPARAAEAANKRYNNNNNNHHLQLARASNRCGGQGSPLLLAKAKAIANKMGASEIDEPTSPKVTCAGQIKVKTKTGRGSCKNWQTVMEEIERIHKKNSSAASSKHKNSDAKKSTWVEALGFKKDLMQFLTCLKGFKVDFRCFGNFHGSGVMSDDDDDEDDDDDVNEDEENDEVRSELGNDHLTSSKSSRTVYSKWFMVLEENKENGLFEENKDAEKNDCPSAAPPPNALLLMRCRSAPAKSWLEEKEEEEKQKQKHEDDQESKDYNNNKLKVLFDEEQKKENLILKCYSPDFTMVSSDVAKETWVVGGIRDSRDPLSRSRSWKR